MNELYERATENLGDVLDLLDQLSASMENVLLAPGVRMAEADRTSRGRNASAARALLQRIGHNHEDAPRADHYVHAFTVVLLRPHGGPPDTFMTTVHAKTPREALAKARAQIIEADCAGFDIITAEPADYACIALIEGEHHDINPEP